MWQGGLPDESWSSHSWAACVPFFKVDGRYLEAQAVSQKQAAGKDIPKLAAGNLTQQII